MQLYMPMSQVVQRVIGMSASSPSTFSGFTCAQLVSADLSSTRQVKFTHVDVEFSPYFEGTASIFIPIVVQLLWYDPISEISVPMTLLKTLSTVNPTRMSVAIPRLMRAFFTSSSTEPMLTIACFTPTDDTLVSSVGATIRVTYLIAPDEPTIV
jgi:hypothetical protein